MMSRIIHKEHWDLYKYAERIGLGLDLRLKGPFGFIIFDFENFHLEVHATVLILN